MTLHPAALLRTPDAERDAALASWFDDFRRATEAAAMKGAVFSP